MNREKITDRDTAFAIQVGRKRKQYGSRIKRAEERSQKSSVTQKQTEGREGIQSEKFGQCSGLLSSFSILYFFLVTEIEVLILYNWERKRISKQLYWKLVHSFIFTGEELIAGEIRSVHYGMSLTIP